MLNELEIAYWHVTNQATKIEQSSNENLVLKLLMSALFAK